MAYDIVYCLLTLRPEEFYIGSYSVRYYVLVATARLEVKYMGSKSVRYDVLVATV